MYCCNVSCIALSASHMYSHHSGGDSVALCMMEGERENDSGREEERGIETDRDTERGRERERDKETETERDDRGRE